MALACDSSGKRSHAESLSAPLQRVYFPFQEQIPVNFLAQLRRPAL